MGIGVDGYSVPLELGNDLNGLNFVSHAHADHTNRVKSGSKVITSYETKALIETRKGINLDVTDAQKGVQLLDSGHILGSKQLYFESLETGYSAVYTGDYQMQISSTAKKICIKESDVVILDSTYPYPNIRFDDREEVVRAIQCYATSKLYRGCVVFGAYSLGRAQELVKIMNGVGLAPKVSESISRLNGVYERFGVKLEYDTTAIGDLDSEKSLRDNFVYIVENSKIKEYASRISTRYNRKVFTAVATGFAKIFKLDTDVQFPLSDHADFAQALEYLEISKPKIVYTVGKEAHIMARNLSRSGYKAMQLNGGIDFCGLGILRVKI